LDQHRSDDAAKAGDLRLMWAAFVGGSTLVVVYLFVIVELVQRTSSVFSAVLSNLKIVLAIVGAELFVQNTRLPAVSWVGILLVTAAFAVMVRRLAAMDYRSCSCVTLCAVLYNARSGGERWSENDLRMDS